MFLLNKKLKNIRDGIDKTTHSISEILMYHPDIKLKLKEEDISIIRNSLIVSFLHKKGKFVIEEKYRNKVLEIFNPKSSPNYKPIFEKEIWETYNKYESLMNPIRGNKWNGFYFIKDHSITIMFERLDKLYFEQNNWVEGTKVNGLLGTLTIDVEGRYSYEDSLESMSVSDYLHEIILHDGDWIFES